MEKLTLAYGRDLKIPVGYRTPGLSDELDPRGKMELAVELGMDVVEPQLNPRELADLDYARRLRAAADEHGVAMPSMGCELPLIDPRPERSLADIVAGAVEFAGVLGVNYLFARVMLSERFPGQQEAWGLLAQNGRQTAEALADHGIRLALEADPPCFVHTLERLERALDVINHENCYPNFDPTNLYTVGSDPLAAIARFGTRIVSGHIKDGFFRGPDDHGEAAVGDGEMDYCAVFESMMKAGIAANMFIEHCRSSEQVRLAASHIRTVLDRCRPGRRT